MHEHPRRWNLNLMPTDLNCAEYLFFFFVFLPKIRASRGRWSPLRTRRCWRTRRLCSTASSLPSRPPLWSGTTRMSCWQTSLGTLSAKPCHYASKSSNSSFCSVFLNSPLTHIHKSCCHQLISSSSHCVWILHWTQWGGTPTASPQLFVCRLNSSLRQIAHRGMLLLE